MSNWIAFGGGGNWTDSGNWQGGVPAAAGSTANFAFFSNTGGSAVAR